MGVAKDGSTVGARDDGTIKRFVACTTDPIIIAGGANSLADGLLATAAVLRDPKGLAVAPDGTLYIADTVNTVVRRVDPNGIISTYAGITGRFYQDGDDAAPATEVAIGGVADIALDAAGNLFIADPHNGRIRKVDAATQTIHAFAGNGSNGFGGDGGAATAASLAGPVRAIVDPSGNVIIADAGNAALRKVTADGKISTILRGITVTDPNLGDGGAASDAYAGPAHIAIDPRNRDIYIADSR